MKRALFLVISLCLSTVAVAQSGERRIFLWDVTLSMKGESYDNNGNLTGYSPDTDIWDKVKEELCKVVSNIVDENTEVIILPFKESILPQTIGPIKADVEGKKKLIDFITGFDTKKPPTRTNITGPITEVMQKYTQKNRRNMVFLFTDGVQNTPSSHTVLEVLMKWNLEMTSNDYLWYVMLTDAAGSAKPIIPDPLPKEDGGNIFLVDPTDNIGFNFIELTPTSPVVYVLSDHFGKTISLQITSNIGVPPGTKIRVTLAEPNPYFDINQESEIKNDAIQITPVFYFEYNTKEVLISSLPDGKISFPMLLEVIDKPQNINLLKNNIDLDVINRRVRTLNITIE